MSLLKLGNCCNVLSSTSGYTTHGIEDHEPAVPSHFLCPRTSAAARIFPDTDENRSRQEK